MNDTTSAHYTCFSCIIQTYTTQQPSVRSHQGMHWLAKFYVNKKREMFVCVCVHYWQKVRDIWLLGQIYGNVKRSCYSDVISRKSGILLKQKRTTVVGIPQEKCQGLSNLLCVLDINYSLTTMSRSIWGTSASSSRSLTSMSHEDEIKPALLMQRHMDWIKDAIQVVFGHSVITRHTCPDCNTITSKGLFGDNSGWR